MTDWARLPLGRICRFQAGDAFPPHLQGRSQGTYPFIKVSDFSLPANDISIARANNWVEEQDVARGLKIHPAGSVVFAKIGIALTYNRRRILTRSTIIDNNLMSASATEGINSLWLYYLLCTLDFNTVASGSAVPYLTVRDLAELEVSVPPPDEQARIALLLNAFDKKLEVNQALNESLEAIARITFKDWFVDYGPTRAKMCGVAPYLQSSLWEQFPRRLNEQEMPEGWAKAKLGDVIETLEAGARPKGGVSAYKEGVPSVGAESIVGLGQFDFRKVKYVPRDFYASMKRGIAMSRDVLVYKDGGRPGEFDPHVTLVGDGFPFNEFCINEHVFRIRANSSYGQSLLFFALSSDAVMEEMRLRGTGVAIPGLNSTQARELSLPNPGSAIAAAFNDLTEPLITNILANCLEARTLIATRDLLLPKVMSGEIRMKDAERALESVV